MADAFEHAIVRVVPDVAREELINAGALVLCEARGYLCATIELDEARLLALCPSVDLGFVRSHLDAIARVCAGDGPMGELPLRERFRWIVAPRNAVIQTSRAHAGMTDDPAATLARIVATMVRLRR